MTRCKAHHPAGIVFCGAVSRIKINKSPALNSPGADVTLRTSLPFSCLLLTCLFPALTAQKGQSGGDLPKGSDIRAIKPTPLASAPPIEVHLTPRIPKGRSGLRWSPKGAKIKLLRHEESLVGELRLGPVVADLAPTPIRIELSKSPGQEQFDRLWLDRNHDGQRSENEVLTTTPSERRSKTWSSFGTLLELPLTPKQTTRPYPLSFWFVKDPAEPDQPSVLRWSRRGWHQGEGKVNGKAFHVLITEMQMDGAFTMSDTWHLSYDAETIAQKAKSRSLSKHAWLDDRAFICEAIDPHGLWIRLRPHDPGITRKEEERRADIFAVDRRAKRAKRPLLFGHDFETAVAEAKAKGKPLLVDFETTWCGPCKQMDAWVYTAAKVADAARAGGIIAVKVDGDARRDLKKRFKVAAYPTMILLSAEGKELRRKQGYTGVAGMRAFLTIK